MPMTVKVMGLNGKPSSPSLLVAGRAALTVKRYNDSS